MTLYPRALPLAGGCGPERRDAADNRQRVLAAARELLSAHGADSLSMNNVAAAACVGKGTIFRRFGDRDGLLEALLEEASAELQDAFLHGPPPLGPGVPAAERLEAFVLALVRFYVQNLELVLAAERRRPAAPPIYATFLIHVATLVSEIDPTLDAPAVAGLLLGAIAPPVLGRLYRQVGVGPERLEAAAVALLHGLTPR